MNRRGVWHRLDSSPRPEATPAQHPCSLGHVHVCTSCSRVTRCCSPECQHLVAARCVGYCANTPRRRLQRVFGTLPDEFPPAA